MATLTYTFNGRTYNSDDYDASTNPTGLGAGGARILWSQMWDDIFADIGPALQMSAADSLAIGTGAKVFTPAVMRPAPIGAYMQATNGAGALMWGQITARTATTVTITVSQVVGTGTFDAWTLQLTGPQAPPAAINDQALFFVQVFS